MLTGLGLNTAVARFIPLYTSQNNQDAVRGVMDQGTYSKGSICVEANCWLGTGVIVLDGVTVKQGAVIGAGALVVKDIPKNVVAVGVPARVVKVREKFSKQAQETV